MRYILALLVALTPGVLAAQAVTVAQIVDALAVEKTGPVVRSLSQNDTRGIAIQGQLPAQLDLPSIDLTINFEFDSTRLTTDSLLTLRALGTALNHASLSGQRFQVAGHTSAEGSDVYNMDLSHRRSMAVVEHLAAFYSVGSDQLYSVGYGESQLLYPQIPNSELNRRVTVINLDPLLN